jgi:hypothetical protein
MIVAYDICERHPEYHGYSNNCQNFVRHLLKYVCPRSSTNVPLTIQETIETLNFRCYSPQVVIEVVGQNYYSGNALFPGMNKEKRNTTLHSYANIELSRLHQEVMVCVRRFGQDRFTIVLAFFFLG